MTCNDIRTKLQDLLDGTLGQGEHPQVQNHLQVCALCLQEYKQLQLFAKAIASLPYYSPTAAFSKKILRALGLEREAGLLPQWTKWTIGALVSLLSFWTAGLIFLLVSRLTFWKVVGAFEFLTNPSEIVTLTKLYLAKSALMLGDCLAMANMLVNLVGPQAADLQIQLTAATALAGIFMVVVSLGTPQKKAPIGAAAGRWRAV